VAEVRHVQRKERRTDEPDDDRDEYAGGDSRPGAGTTVRPVPVEQRERRGGEYEERDPPSDLRQYGGGRVESNVVEDDRERRDETEHHDGQYERADRQPERERADLGEVPALGALEDHVQSFHQRAYSAGCREDRGEQTDDDAEAHAAVAGVRRARQLVDNQV